MTMHMLAWLTYVTTVQAITPLRLMALGASITWGSKSSHGNGYREHLHELLIEGGYEVDMVGSRKNGAMADNDVEGWPGARIDQVHNHARASVPKLLPNIFTLNAGGNDCMQDHDTANMTSRMEDLVEDLWLMAPQSTVILSTLTVNADFAAEECVQRANKHYRHLVEALQAESRRIVLAEMRGDGGPDYEDLADHVHPGDGGYVKMANIWFDAITVAKDRGILPA
ncbi:carbohydrate esterase family 3 protein [Paramyrothecium foliicola]|nr:carbohydrate esterase family 3 protein [Paramyrothecium foliicola]